MIEGPLASTPMALRLEALLKLNSDQCLQNAR